MAADREHAYVSLSAPVDLEVRWHERQEVVGVVGSHGTYPTLSVYMPREQASALAADLIQALLASDPEWLPDGLLDAMLAAIGHHWRDEIADDGQTVEPVGGGVRWRRA